MLTILTQQLLSHLVPVAFSQSGVITRPQQLAAAVTVSSALQSGVRVLVDRPASVLPVYLLVIGLTATARVPVLIAIGVIIALSAADGRLDAVLTEVEALLAEIEAEAAAESPPETVPEEIPAGLETAFAELFTPTVIALLVGGVVLAVIVSVLARALGNAAAINGIYGALYGSDAVADAVAGVGRDWRAFLGVTLLQVGVVLLALVPLAVAAGLFAFSPVAGGVGLLIGVPLAAAVGIGGLLLLAFAGQSIVVDRAGFAAAIRQSAGFPIRRPTAFVAYVPVAIAVFASISVAGTVFGLLGVSQLSGILTPLVAFPFLDAFKTALYADRPFEAATDTSAIDAGVADATVQTAAAASGPDATPTAEQPVEPDTIAADKYPSDAEGLPTDPTPSSPRHRERFIAAFRDGMLALGGFIRGHPLPIAAAIGLFSLAAVGGVQLTAAIETDLPLPEDVRNIFGTFPVGTFVMLAANNWLVSASAAYSGVAFGIPTAVDMVLNGTIVGAVYGITDPIVFLALVAPHGVIELPAIFVAGGLGFHLAAVTVSVLTGRATTDALAAALRLAYRVLLGLAVVLIIAAFVEAFLTPLIASVVLG